MLKKISTIMFQIFTRRVFMSNSNAVGTLQFARLNSTLQNRTRAKEIREVKLIGTIYQEPITLRDGMKVLTVKTVKEDGHYKVHRAIVRSPKILNIFGNNLSVGQRVYIAGELQSMNFTNNENKPRQSYQVKVNELYASKAESNDEPSRYTDQNNVCILSHIVSDIFHLDNHSVFNVCGHYLIKSPNESESEMIQFYRVFVHDADLIQALKNNFQKRDRILINGALGSRPETDINGQKKLSGHIEATHILRVDRFSEAVEENSIEESYKNANE